MNRWLHPGALSLALTYALGACAEPDRTAEAPAGSAEVARTALAEGCAELADSLVDHACLHAQFGPFRTVSGSAARDFAASMPNVDAVHTHYSVSLPGPLGANEGTVKYRPARSGQWAVLTHPADASLTVLDAGGQAVPALLSQTTESCAQLSQARVYSLTANATYRFVLGPSTRAESVGVLLENLGDFGASVTNICGGCDKAGAEGCDEEDPIEHVVEHACPHGRFGPFESVVASEPFAGGPDVSRPHRAYRVGLPGGGRRQGEVIFEVQQAGDYVFMLNSEVRVRVLDPQGRSVPALVSRSVGCTALSRLWVFALPAGKHRLVFGPTIDTSVMLVIERLHDEQEDDPERADDSDLAVYEGNFKHSSGPDLLYSNGRGHYCKYKSMRDWSCATGKIDAKDIPAFSSYDMTALANDGPCNVSRNECRCRPIEDVAADPNLTINCDGIDAFLKVKWKNPRWEPIELCGAKTCTADTGKTPRIAMCWANRSLATFQRYCR